MRWNSSVDGRMSPRCSRLRSTRFADYAGIPCDRRADKVWCQHKRRVGGELSGETFLGQLNSITFNTWELDFQSVAFGPHSLDLDGFTGRLWRRHNRFSCEIEWYAEDIGIFHVEQAFLVEVVRLPAQGAADDLFTQKLGAEGADAENMGHGVRVPTFRQH